MYLRNALLLLILLSFCNSNQGKLPTFVHLCDINTLNPFTYLDQPHLDFETNKWIAMNLTIEEKETLNEDYFKDVYGNPWINGFVIGIYFCGSIFIFGLIFVSWFERSGLSGPYRTLVNQLVIFNVESVRKQSPNSYSKKHSSIKNIYLLS